MCKSKYQFCFSSCVCIDISNHSIVGLCLWCTAFWGEMAGRRRPKRWVLNCRRLIATPAFSTPAFWCHVFHSLIFSAAPPPPPPPPSLIPEFSGAELFVNRDAPLYLRSSRRFTSYAIIIIIIIIIITIIIGSKPTILVSRLSFLFLYTVTHGLYLILDGFSGPFYRAWKIKKTAQ